MNWLYVFASFPQIVFKQHNAVANFIFTQPRYIYIFEFHAIVSLNSLSIFHIPYSNFSFIFRNKITWPVFNWHYFIVSQSLIILVSMDKTSFIFMKLCLYRALSSWISYSVAIARYIGSGLENENCTPSPQKCALPKQYIRVLRLF